MSEDCASLAFLCPDCGCTKLLSAERILKEQEVYFIGKSSHDNDAEASYDVGTHVYIAHCEGEHVCIEDNTHYTDFEPVYVCSCCRREWETMKDVEEAKGLFPGDFRIQ